MKNIFLILFFIFSQITFAKAPDEGDFTGPIIIGGGGVGEYSVVFAHGNLPRLLEDCLGISCNLTELEKTTVRTLLNQTLPKFSFERADTMGTALFSVANDQVLINQDELWSDPAKTEAYGISEATALWLAILAKVSSQSLDPQLLEKVRMASRQDIVRASGQDEQYEYLHWRRADESDQLFVRDSSLQTVSLIPHIEAALNCGADQPTVKIYSPAWTSDSFVNSTKRVVSIGFGIEWSCGTRSGNTSGVAVIEGVQNGSQLIFDAQSVFVQIEL